MKDPYASGRPRFSGGRVSRCRAAAPALLFAGVVACGGSKPSPVTPSPEPSFASGTTVTIRSGENEQPVASALISLSGQNQTGAFTVSYTTNGAGQFSLDRNVYQSPAPSVEITAAGFLVRSTSLRSGETTISLWPSAAGNGFDEVFSSTTVYSGSACPAINTGQSPLRRVGASTGVVQISFGSTLQDTAAENAHRQAILRLNDATGNAPRYEFTTGTPGAVAFIADIDPAAATCTAGPEPLRASTSLNFAGGYISGGRLTYCTVEAARSASLVLHELGHTLGFYHSASTSDVMYCSGGRPPVFSGRERLAISLMRQRRASNRWPDNDRQAASSFGVITGGAEVIACGERPPSSR